MYDVIVVGARCAGALAPPLQQYFGAAAHEPTEVTRILGALGGSIPSDEVFS
jgi:hypothetical protein